MSIILKTILLICIGNTLGMSMNHLPKHVEVIAGEEYVNAAERNDTLMLKLG